MVAGLPQLDTFYIQIWRIEWMRTVSHWARARNDIWLRFELWHLNYFIETVIFPGRVRKIEGLWGIWPICHVRRVGVDRRPLEWQSKACITCLFMQIRRHNNVFIRLFACCCECCKTIGEFDEIATIRTYVRTYVRQTLEFLLVFWSAVGNLPTRIKSYFNLRIFC